MLPVKCFYLQFSQTFLLLRRKRDEDLLISKERILHFSFFCYSDRFSCAITISILVLFAHLLASRFLLQFRRFLAAGFRIICLILDEKFLSRTFLVWMNTKTAAKFIVLFDRASRVGSPELKKNAIRTEMQQEVHMFSSYLMERFVKWNIFWVGFFLLYCQFIN